MVIIMGVQYYEGREHRYVDYPVADVLQMMGRACRPTVDERSRCLLMCQQTRKEFNKKFLNEGLPIESHLPAHFLHDFVLAEIDAETIDRVNIYQATRLAMLAAVQGLSVDPDHLLIDAMRLDHPCRQLNQCLQL